MARDCEVNDCGVVAVGACVDCGRAFCISHQAFLERVKLVDQCSECRTQVVAGQQAERDEEARAEDWVRTQAGVYLRQHRVPMTHLAHRYELPRRRRQKQADVAYDLVEPGWLIGELRWSWSYERATTGGSATRELEKTFGQPNAIGGLALLIVTVNQDGYVQPRNLDYTHLASSWRDVRRLIESLTD